MTRIHAKDLDLLVDEHEFSAVANRVAIEIENGLGDVTAFADVDATFVEGKPGFTLTVDGLFSTASPNYDGEMFADLTAEGRRVGVYPPGSVDGNVGYEAKTNVGSQERPVETGAAALLHVGWRGDTPIVRATIMFKAAAQASSADGTKRELGAVAASQTVVSVLRLLSAPGGSGDNDCVVTIESDADASAGSETTRLTHTTLDQDSVALHEVQEAAGAITDTWWRVVVTISGAGSRTFDLLVAVGIRPT